MRIEYVYRTCTALHYASRGNNKEMVGILIAKGADPLSKDHYGATPIDYANSQEIKLLLEQAAEKCISTKMDSLRVDNLGEKRQK